MSQPASAFRQQEDTVSGLGLAAAAFVVLAVSALMITVAYVIDRDREVDLRPSGAFPERELGPRRSVARVQQDLFTTTGVGQRLAEDERHRLERYRWVDKGNGIVAVPIERAMDLYLLRDGGTR